MKLGLVDRLGGIPEALDLAREKAGIAKDQPVKIRVLPRPKNFLESFLQSDADSLARLRQTAALPPELARLYAEYEYLRPLTSEPFVLVAPEVLPGGDLRLADGP